MPSRKPSKAPPPSPRDERKARLAEALRENLRRRKAQARERRDDDPPEEPKDR